MAVGAESDDTGCDGKDKERENQKQRQAQAASTREGGDICSAPLRHFSLSRFGSDVRCLCAMLHIGCEKSPIYGFTKSDTACFNFVIRMRLAIFQWAFIMRYLH